MGPIGTPSASAARPRRFSNRKSHCRDLFPAVMDVYRLFLGHVPDRTGLSAHRSRLQTFLTWVAFLRLASAPDTVSCDPLSVLYRSRTRRGISFGDVPPLLRAGFDAWARAFGCPSVGSFSYRTPSWYPGRHPIAFYTTGTYPYAE